jgi:hypothetical protein
MLIGPLTWFLQCSANCTSDTAVDDCDLLLDGHGHVLALLEQLREADTAVQQLLGGGVEVGAELGEGGHLAVLGQLELHGTGDLRLKKKGITKDRGYYFYFIFAKKSAKKLAF